MTRTGDKARSHPGVRRVGPKEFVVRVAMRDRKTGKQRERERRLTNMTLAEALQEQAKLREELRDVIEQGARTPRRVHGDGSETLSAFAKRWLKLSATTGRRRKHVVRHTLFLLERFILPIMGDLVVQDIRRADLVEWMGRVGELRREDGKPYARESFKGAWGVLRTMLRDALVLCDLERDPTLGVRFTAPGMERAVKDVLTREELNRVLTATVDESPDIALMIWLGFTTGMRYGEMTALSWSDVDVERGLIRVRKSQVAGAVGPTKTRMPRSVPIHPVVLDKLKAHREQQETKKVRGLSTGLVFPSSNGKHRLSGVLTKPLARCVKKAGVDKHVTAHTMRRTFNNLSRQAAGEIVTRSIVGHATSEMTEHYSEVTHEEKQRALVAALGTLPTMDFAGDRCWGSAQEGENPSSFVV